MNAPSDTPSALPPTTVRAEMMLLMHIMLPAVAPTACSASSAEVDTPMDLAATCTSHTLLRYMQLPNVYR